MTLPSYAVDFRGHPACPCQIAWLPAYESELQRRGLLSGQLPIYQLIGNYVASGSTHALGGVADFLDLPGGEDVWVARQMGADATWSRLAGWDNGGGIAHIHSVLRGCPHLSQSARDQIGAVDRGGDGLVGDAPDNGPRPLSYRTWQEGIAWAHQQEEADMFTDADKTWISDTIDKRLAAFLAAAEVNNPSDAKGSPWKLTRLLIDTWKRAGK